MDVLITGESYIYRNPSPAARSRQAFFPGVAKLPNGELLALFVMGEAFEAANCRAHKARSLDGGASWQYEGPMFPDGASVFGPTFSDGYKPTTLADGTLLAAGYGFVREDPELSLSDAIARGALPPCHNVVARSVDGGRHWTPPAPMGAEVDGLELSGPAVCLRDGRVVCAAPRFSPFPDGPQQGLTFSSGDQGRSWRRLGDYFDLPGVTAWETRCVESEPGKLALLLWAYDLRRREHQCNYFATSDDGGETWNAPVATGVMAQASTLLYLGGQRLLTLHAHRSAEECGLFLRHVDIAGGRFETLDSRPLWQQASMRNADGGIDRQFANLKFGQPGLLHVTGDDYLAYCWLWEDMAYVCKAYRLRITAR